MVILAKSIALSAAASPMLILAATRRVRGQSTDLARMGNLGSVRGIAIASPLITPTRDGLKARVF
jgi:hypothetical protein